MKKPLPPINSTVKVKDSIMPNDPRIGQKGVVIEHSGSGTVCVHFWDMPEGRGIFFNPSELEVTG